LIGGPAVANPLTSDRTTSAPVSEGDTRIRGSQQLIHGRPTSVVTVQRKVSPTTPNRSQALAQPSTRLVSHTASGAKGSKQICRWRPGITLAKAAIGDSDAQRKLVAMI
jgi:hypothetical protein